MLYVESNLFVSLNGWEVWYMNATTRILRTFGSLASYLGLIIWLSSCSSRSDLKTGLCILSVNDCASHVFPNNITIRHHYKQASADIPRFSENELFWHIFVMMTGMHAVSLSKVYRTALQCSANNSFAEIIRKFTSGWDAFFSNSLISTGNFYYSDRSNEDSTADPKVLTPDIKFIEENVQTVYKDLYLSKLSSSSSNSFFVNLHFVR